MNHYLTNKNLNVASVVLAVLMFVGAKYYIDVQFLHSKERDETKLAIISEQIASRLDIFYASRTRALELISQNWPDAHPNLQQWFTHSSLDILYILPGIESIWYQDKAGDTRWRAPLSAQQAQDLNPLSLTSYLDERVYVSPIFTLASGVKALAIVKPQFSNGQLTGWLVCVIDFKLAFYFMLGDYEHSDMFISLYDSNELLIQDGTNAGGVHYSRELSFGEKSFVLTLGTRAPIFDRHAYTLASALFILAFILVLRLLVLKSIKASVSQRRFVAATKNSLDGLLIFRKQGGKYYLSDINRVAEGMLQIATNKDEGMTFLDFIRRLQLDTCQDLQQAPKQVTQGQIFNRAYQISPSFNGIAYIKMQIVSAGNDIAVTVRDISPRKLAELNLKKREEKYRRLVEDLSGHFLYSLDASGRFDYVSASVKDILGVSQEEFLADIDKYLSDGDTNQARLNSLNALAQGEKSTTYRLEFSHGNNQVKLLELTDAPVIEQGKLVAIEGIAKDITKEKALADEVYYQANHDALTGLNNRYAFDTLLNDIIAAVTDQGKKASLCYVDLDQFKIVNDTSGHMAGDELLNQLGAMILNTISQRHIVARLGGDEFGVIFVNCDIQEAKARAENLLKQISDFRFVWEDKLFKVSASIGIAPINPGISHDEVMKSADVACYVAKDAGRNRVNVYSEDDEELNYHKSRIDWANRIQNALEQNRFRLFCQTIKPLTHTPQSELCYEILLRMLDDKGELVSPALFIPAAERFDLMHDIDRWVFKEAVELLSSSPNLLAQTGKCSINLSGASIVEESFAECIIETLTAKRIPPEKICFEITETEAVTKLSNAGHFIEKLRNFGCKFALDDFGAGMCSFSYLKHLPVDYIKIDGSFVKNLCSEATDKAIVQSINDIARSLGKQTIAEFVSDLATEEILREIGVNYVQGYFIDQPVPFVQYVKQRDIYALQQRKSA